MAVDVIGDESVLAHDEATYAAFVAYRRAGGRLVARWLSVRLERYRASRKLLEQLPPDVRARLQSPRRVFLDERFERSNMDFWEAHVLPALLRSRRLIVLSTADAFEPHEDGSDNWLVREIDAFWRASGDASRIVLTLGPGAPEDRFPGRLSSISTRWDWADLRTFSFLYWLWPGRARRIEDAFSKILAGVFDIPRELIPELRGEEKRRRRLIRVGMLAVAALLVGLSVLAPYAAYLAHRNAEQERSAQRNKTSNLLEKGAREWTAQQPSRGLMNVYASYASAQAKDPIRASGLRALSWWRDGAVARLGPDAGRIDGTSGGDLFATIERSLIRIWRASDGAPVGAPLPGLNVDRVLIDPAGTWVATFARDGAIDLWDPVTGERRDGARHDQAGGMVACPWASNIAFTVSNLPQVNVRLWRFDANSAGITLLHGARGVSPQFTFGCDLAYVDADTKRLVVFDVGRQAKRELPMSVDDLRVLFMIWKNPNRMFAVRRDDGQFLDMDVGASLGQAVPTTDMVALAAAQAPRVVLVPKSSGIVRLVDGLDGSAQTIDVDEPVRAWLSPDGRALALVSRSAASLWAWGDGSLKRVDSMGVLSTVDDAAWQSDRVGRRAITPIDRDTVLVADTRRGLLSRAELQSSRLLGLERGALLAWDTDVGANAIVAWAPRFEIDTVRLLPHEAEVRGARLIDTAAGLRVATDTSIGSMLWEARPRVSADALLRVASEVVLSPDAQAVVEHTHDGHVVAWQIRAEGMVRVGSGWSRHGIRSARFAANGRDVVVFDRMGRVTIWGLSSAGLALRGAWGAPRGTIDVDVSGDRAIVVTKHGVLSVHDAATGRRLDPPLVVGERGASVRMAPSGERAIAFGPGVTFVSVGADGVRPLEHWVPSDPSCRHDRFVGAWFSWDSRLIAAATGNHVHVWSVGGEEQAVGREIAHLPMADGVDAVSFGSGNKSIFVASGRGVRGWTLADRHSDSWEMLQQPVSQIATSPDGETVVAMEDSRGGTTPVYWVLGGSGAYGLASKTVVVGFDRKGKGAITLDADGAIRRSKGRRPGSPIRVNTAVPWISWGGGRAEIGDEYRPGAVPGVAFAAEGTSATVRGDVVEVRSPIWRGATRSLPHPANVIALSIHREFVVTAAADQRVRVWRISDDPRLVGEYEAGEPVAAVAMDGTGEAIFAGGANGQLSVFTAGGISPARRRQVASSAITVLHVSPNGETVATGSLDGTARMWSTEMLAPISPPLMHGGPVTAAAFSSDGTLFLTGSTDLQLRVWDTVSGIQLGPPMVHGGAVTAIQVEETPRRSIVSGDDSGAVRYWTTPSVLPDDQRRLRPWVEMITGRAWSAEGDYRKLGVEEWFGRRSELDRLGGPFLSDNR
ncbi:MAG TPA: WD40 repeat domain-containing protein [Candidatus Binatia bacterium]|jgi:WD40 repeat protein|nr:WD40 repeat domain-containing protein [Candidatus Binatia bacterium]